MEGKFISKRNEVIAQDMCLGEYNDFKGWAIPENENPKAEGFLITSKDGNTTWCAKQKFLNDYEIVEEPKLWFQGEERELTFGEKAVGVSFNPSKMPEVDSIKANFAQLIDLMEDNKFNTRLGAMLKTEAQMNCVRASMSIVKLLTFTE